LPTLCLFDPVLGGEEKGQMWSPKAVKERREERMKRTKVTNPQSLLFESDRTVQHWQYPAIPSTLSDKKALSFFCFT